MQYLGEYAPGQTVRFAWNTNAVAGESITRSTNGTIYVYKDGATGTEVTTGVTDTEDFDSVTGVHYCEIATSDAFYATGSHYLVVLKSATIDGKSISAALAGFRIKKESNSTLVEYVRNKDATDQTFEMFVRDLRTGQGLTGLAYNTSGITLRYQRSKSASVSVTLATQTATGAHSDGGLVEIDATHRPGWYRVDSPDAAFATGVDDVGFTLYGAANMADSHAHIQLVDAVTVSGGRVESNVTYWNGSAVATPDTSGYPKVTLKSGTGTGEVNLSSGNLAGSVASVTGAVGSVTGNVGGSVASVTAGVTVTTNNDKTGYRLSATGVDDVLDEVYEGSETFRQGLRLIRAALLGKASGLDTTTAVFRDAADSKNRISATVDANGNRTAVTTDAT